MIGSFTNVWFCNTCIGHLENIGPLSYAELANVGASLCNIKKITIVNITTYFIRKAFKYWEADKLKFYKILIFT